MTDDELAGQLRRAEAAAPVGSRWVHRNGGRYSVVGHAVIEATLEAGVVYHLTHSDGITWCRPAGEFLDGRFTRADP